MQPSSLPPLSGPIIPAAAIARRTDIKDRIEAKSNLAACRHTSLGLMLAASFGLSIGASVQQQFAVLKWMFVGICFVALALGLLSYYVKPAKRSKSVTALVGGLWTYSQSRQLHQHLPQQMLMVWLTLEGLYFRSGRHETWAAFRAFDIESADSGYYKVTFWWSKRKNQQIVWKVTLLLSSLFMGIFVMLTGGIMGLLHLGLRDDVLASLLAGLFTLLTAAEIGSVTGLLRRGKRPALTAYVSVKDVPLERLEDFLSQAVRADGRQRATFGT